MAGIRPLSPADLHREVSPPPRPAAALPLPPPRPGSGSDALDLSGDGRALSRAILIKVALEGKDFQTARREVLAEHAGSPAPPPPMEALGANAERTKLNAVRIDYEHLEVDLQSEGQSLHLEVTRLQVQAVQVSRSRGGPSARPKQDPLLLDLDGNGASTTGATGARAFDLAGDGDRASTSFVAGGDAFLALDRNGDGAITSGLELFGDQHGATDGYEELRRFDANQDGLIDQEDPVFKQLKLLYGDGRVGRLQDAGISALSLAAQDISTTTSAGDDILRHATAQRADGSTLDTYALGLQRFNAVG